MKKSELIDKLQEIEEDLDVYFMNGGHSETLAKGVQVKDILYVVLIDDRWQEMHTKGVVLL